MARLANDDEILPAVHVIDDDRDMRETIEDILVDVGYDVRCYDGVSSFIDEMAIPSGVILLDLRLRGISGLGLQAKIGKRPGTEIVFISGVAEIPDTIAAMKAGAHDFLIKPIRPQVLIDAVADAMEKVMAATALVHHTENLRATYEMLTDAEREIAILVAQGFRTKQIAEMTGRTEGTVKVHRSRIMQKMATATPYELMVRLRAIGVVGRDHSPA